MTTLKATWTVHFNSERRTLQQKPALYLEAYIYINDNTSDPHISRMYPSIVTINSALNKTDIIYCCFQISVSTSSFVGSNSDSFTTNDSIMMAINSERWGDTIWSYLWGLHKNRLHSIQLIWVDLRYIREMHFVAFIQLYWLFVGAIAHANCSSWWRFSKESRQCAYHSDTWFCCMNIK